jgi:hypothetical protein
MAWFEPNQAGVSLMRAPSSPVSARASVSLAHA